MQGMPIDADGLTSEEARARLLTYGFNQLVAERPFALGARLLGILAEPMILLLAAAATVYFILGEARDGATMLAFVIGVYAINAVQELKAERTLKALQGLAEPQVTVLRDGREQRVASAELVPGDLALVHEGMRVPADGRIAWCSDLCVDESTLSGEAEAIWKQPASQDGPSFSPADSQATDESLTGLWRRDYCYAGTLVLQGSAALLIDRTGQATAYGKAGAAVAAAPDAKTPLQGQVAAIVKACAVAAALLFAMAGLLTWQNAVGLALRERLVASILAGITLAMAMIPEEFPVILAIFLSLGAWRLAKQNALVRRLPAVEALGSVSFLCVDKTGTLTMNQMAVSDVWAADDDLAGLLEACGLACEMEAFDPTEQAMLAYCEGQGFDQRRLSPDLLLHEYAFTSEQMMMGHAWRLDGQMLIAAKGSPERTFDLCHLDAACRQAAEAALAQMGGSALRVIAVASASLPGTAAPPDRLGDCALELRGLIGLDDPPRPSVKEDIASLSRAGIRVAMVTGDNPVTAAAIASQIGLPSPGNVLIGEDIERLSDAELSRLAPATSVFARVAPEHKMRIVCALQAAGEVVAACGDGVNDAPALRHADIGIAMGGRGSEVARQAADLILLDDNFTTIVNTVRDGRRIYDNIKKAVGYVLAVHMPIALISLAAPALGISPGEGMLMPMHVVLLELLIDPTCSIVLERLPAELDSLKRPPRDSNARLLDARTMIISMSMGLAIFAAAFGAYLFALRAASDFALAAAEARTMGLCVIVFANLLMVLTLGSETEGLLSMARRLSQDRLMWAAAGIVLASVGLLAYTPLGGALRLAPLSAWQMAAALGLAAASVLWYEAVKLGRRWLMGKAQARG